MKQDVILIIDLGSRENTILAREIRDMGVFTEIHPHDLTKEQLDNIPNIKGIILNGGENNIVDGVAIDASESIYNYGVPILSLDCNGEPVLSKVEKERKSILNYFVFDVAKAQKNWNVENFLNDQIALIREKVGDKKVLLALSGGVDSSVVAALLNKAIGNQLTCIHVNHGLLRAGEPEQVIKVFGEELDTNLIYIDATDRYLDALSGVSEPEQKRHIIGELFIRIFEEEARKLDGIEFLAQGTIYPDIIESGTKTQKAVKSHHNVGGLPEDMQFELIEPLAMLFKDEVRKCGVALGLPDKMVYRQPFPGPGLGVRCTGAITRGRLEAVRQSDVILREELENAGFGNKIWQYFTIVPDVKSVGVKNDERAFEWPCVIRMVNTVDAMTASVPDMPFDLLQKIVYRITHEVEGINRVLWDMTPKPTGTIEWE